jgi:hypothetical protein
LDFGESEPVFKLECRLRVVAATVLPKLDPDTPRHQDALRPVVRLLPREKTERTEVHGFVNHL